MLTTFFLTATAAITGINTDKRGLWLRVEAQFWNSDLIEMTCVWCYHNNQSHFSTQNNQILRDSMEAFQVARIFSQVNISCVPLSIALSKATEQSALGVPKLSHKEMKTLFLSNTI